MYARSWGLYLLAIDGRSGKLVQVHKLPPPNGVELVEVEESVLRSVREMTSTDGPASTVLTSGPLQGYHLVRGSTANTYYLQKDQFVCAAPVRFTEHLEVGR